MTPASRRMVFFVAYISIAGGLWGASNWWEKALATRVGESSISPGGCYRLETFTPFWVLPAIFHRRSDPNEDGPPKWLPWWGYPGFLRLYDHRNGLLISETKIYDFESAGGQLDWGDGDKKLWAGMISMDLDLPDCIGDVPGKTRREQ